MRKEDLKKQVKRAGDATITYRSQNSRKLKYNVCTLDFDNPHIQSKDLRVEEGEDTVLMFCWDCDSFRLLQPEDVVSVVPLSATLRNKSPIDDI